ncbi:uncharacterized protein DFL_004473 [Arthrobotrys flagrans]|uniref:Uncharacterized protein n=1 Tax=Arthrobotrys flagrans TaxID=97331 RepID=A0A437A4S4_ARTFL|nr:hypothetical protein DFL_004473 [Arthrobotrys flagrans]
MTDDNDINLEILKSLSPIEKQQIKEAYNRGASLLDKEEEISRNPVHQDPDFEWDQLEESVSIRTNVRGLVPRTIEILREMERDDVVGDPRSYIAVFRSILKSDGTRDYDSTVLRTYISKEENHLYFPWPGELPAGAQYRDWIYQCWLRGSQPTMDGSNGKMRVPLKYITIEGISNQDTLATFKAVEREWESRSLDTGIEGGLALTREDIDPKLAKSTPDSVSYFKFVVFSILSGLHELSPVVEMLSTFPNTFYQHQVSTIRFKVEGDGGSANVLLELELPIEHKYAGFNPTDNVVTLQTLGSSLQVGTSFNLIRHPSRPDIERTSYGWQGERSSNPGSTFSRSGVQYKETGYRFAISGLEKHLVFEGYLIGAAATQVLQDFSEKEVDQEMHHVLYSAWLHTAGQVALSEVTFASVHPQSRNKLKEIRNKQKPAGISQGQWDDKITVFEELNMNFGEILQILSDTREGRILGNLLQRYGDHLGISRISRLEIGIYTAPGSKKRKGKPFILVGFGQRLKTDFPNTQLAQAGDINPGTQSWKSDIPTWLLSVSAGSIEGIYSEAMQRGAYVNSVAEIEHLFLGGQTDSELAYTPEELQLLVSNYQFTDKSDSVVPRPVADQLNYLYNLQQPAMNGNRRAFPEFFFDSTLFQPYNWVTKNWKITYDSVRIRRAPASAGNTNWGDTSQYDLLINLHFGFVVVASQPKTLNGHAMELENTLYAAWHYLHITRSYSYDTFAKKTICTHGPRYFFIFDVQHSTRLIIEEIYKQRSLEKSEALILTGADILNQPFRRNSAYLMLGTEGNFENLRDFLALLGSPDLIGISRLATRYYGTQHMLCRTAVKHIVIRWISTPEAEELRPELFLSLRENTNGRPSTRRIHDAGPDQIFALTQLVEPAVFGRTVQILDRLRVKMPVNTDSESGGSTWDVLRLKKDTSCPQRSLQLLDSGMLNSNLREFKKAITKPYRQFQMKSRIEDRSYVYLLYQSVNPRAYGHLIMQALPTIADGSNQGVEQLSEIYLNAWEAGSKGSSRRLGPLRLVTFLELSPETQSIARLLSQALRTGQDANSQGLDIKLRVTLHGQVMAERLPREIAEYWNQRAGIWHRIAWQVLTGTPEILGLAHSLRVRASRSAVAEPGIQQQYYIHTVYLESSKDGSGVQCVVYLTKQTHQKGDIDKVEDDDDDKET